MPNQGFVVISTKNADAVREEVYRFPDLKAYELKDDTWFVSYDGTTRELAEKIGIRQGRIGSGVVILVGAYAGYASTDLWEWLRANRKSDD